MSNVHARPEKKGLLTGKFVWRSLCAILLAVVLLLTLLNLNKFGIFPFGTPEAADSTTQDQTGGEPGQPGEQSPSENGPDLSSIIAETDTSSGPWIVAGHEDYRFSIVGVVPDQETKEAISRAVNVIFARFNTQDIKVDPSVGSTAWTDSPDDGLIPMLRVVAFRMNEGQFIVNNQATRIQGKFPDVEVDGVAYAEQPKIAFGQSTTLPTYEQEIELASQTKTMELKASYDGETLHFSGALPNEEIVDQAVADAQLLLGNVQITQNIAIDDEVFAPLPVMNFQQYIKAFALSREFDIGVQNGGFTGSVTYGIQFDEDSSEIPEQVQGSLDDFAVLLQRAGFPVEIIGHTDSTGSPQENLVLSQARAESVRDYLLQDLSAERAENITALGKGDTNPIEDNNTEEGRNENRRVEINIAGGKPF